MGKSMFILLLYHQTLFASTCTIVIRKITQIIDGKMMEFHKFQR